MSKLLIETGGARGIGAAFARRAAQDGWQVVVIYNASRAAAEAVVDEIWTKGGEALALPGDVAVAADVLALFDAAEVAFGPIGGTINTAGFLDPARPLAEIGHARWQRIFAITPTGSFLAAREAVRRMLRAGHGGVIVNMWSMAAQVWGS